MPDARDHRDWKWGDSLDFLVDEHKMYLRDRLEQWDPGLATEERPGPFAGERLDGLEVYWLAACARAGEYGEPTLSTEELVAQAPPFGVRVQLLTLNLCKADLHGVNLTLANLNGANLRGANLREATLRGADLSEADLTGADLTKASLFRANLRAANLRTAILQRADLFASDMTEAHLNRADVREATLSDAILDSADLFEADLREAMLLRASLRHANLRRAALRGAILSDANLSDADVSEADLRLAYLEGSQVVRTNLSQTNMTGCSVYGIAVWDPRLDGTIQTNLIIAPEDEPAITVDDLEVAQFLYLMLHNHKIRTVIDTITSKVVLILGRFTPDRKPVLDALRDELRRRNYLPVVFDFEKPARRDLTETISTLAHMARFVIADLTDARSIPQELAVIVPSLPSVAIQPIIQAGQAEYGMFEHWRRFPWVLAPYRYQTLDTLLAALADHVIAPAEQRANEIAPRK